MKNGTYLKNETGPPYTSGPLLIEDIITRFLRKASPINKLEAISNPPEADWPNLGVGRSV